MAVNINVPSQVKTYANLAAFPATGALKTIYIAEDTNKTYRWTGSVYTEISASAAMTWGAIGGTLSNQTDLQNALDAKQDDITLTTTGSSGASTLVGATLNVPNYTLSGLGGVPTSRTLTINGVTQDLSANRTFTISTGITIGSTAIASGTVGRILFEGAGNVVQESSSLTYDDTLKTFTLIGPISSVIQHTALTNYNGLGGLQLNVADGTERGLFKLNPTSGEVRIGATGSGYFPTFYAQGVEAMRIFASTRNVGVGTTTDAGFRLDVNGTARVKTDLKIETATGGLIIEGDASGYPTLKINTLRSGTTRRNWMFATEQINGGDFILFRSATAGGVANTLVYSIFNDGNFGLNTSTNAGFRLDVNGTARVQSTLTLGGEIFGSTNTYFNGPSLNTGTLWLRFNAVNSNGNFTATGPVQGTNVIASGTNSQLSSTGAGVQGVLITNTATSTNWRIEGHRTTSGALEFKNDLTNPVLNLFSSRNVGIGTFTDIASAKLIIESTTQGFLPPRMTTTQKNAIASPATGLMVYDTTLNLISVYNGTMWITL